ncbi:hypothetical protein CC85DRAFT_305963 [Cutaneotrichosporon oleaginosum]|uniref:Uncharacterized protein n=1 Tax=Cutaneotrichosporon oleaginosum TaxID=879819 RepID=A0A0J0XBJ7_9TREE|nr:uncharacterized protein CC85DRAFT_305963 [Cutaneotrichosporon oleaginosum]KLT38445.1 hypothetical protein CC85DRAFT_305963 [Cutaneotrichosporon oleaginosum]TXT08294.1 hypothetical protein COLE_05218 [Cutaneotrichosporon oleaginosum]
MGNSQAKLANTSVTNDAAVPVCTSPVRRWDGSTYNKDTVTSYNSSVTPAPTTWTPTSAHGRSVSVAPESTHSLVTAEQRSAPVAHHHQRAASESGSIIAAPVKPDPPPRRALGLVRKISFRSRGERATPTARIPPPARASSADDAELLITRDDEPVAAPPAKLTISTSHSSALTRAASLGQKPQPARPMRSARRSAQTAFGTEESPAASPAKATARGEQGPVTPTHPVNRALVPRSPKIGPVSPRRSSPGGSPHRQSMTTARRAEREWKAKIAALTAGPPSPGRTRPSNGPRPPPRRVLRPSAPPSFGGTDVSGGIAQSLSLSHLSLDNIDSRMSSASCPPSHTLDSIRELPAIDHPGSAFNAPSTVFTGVSGMTKSASTTSISRPSKRSPGSSIVALPGVPEYERTPLSPIEQEPVSPSSPPVTGIARAVRPVPALHQMQALHSPAPSIAKSLAPSTKTFGPGPSPSTMPRPLDWMPDERVVVSRSSVPDLARVSSPPPVPSLPPGLRLAEMATPAPVPSCTPPPTQPIVPPRRSESRRIESKPVDPVVIAATPSHRFARLGRRDTDSPEPSVLPRTTSLQHARDMESPRATSEADDVPSDTPVRKLHSTYDLTPGLESGHRPRKTGLPMDDLQRWLAQTAMN